MDDRESKDGGLRSEDAAEFGACRGICFRGVKVGGEQGADSEDSTEEKRELAKAEEECGGVESNPRSSFVCKGEPKHILSGTWGGEDMFVRTATLG